MVVHRWTEEVRSRTVCSAVTAPQSFWKLLSYAYDLQNRLSSNDASAKAKNSSLIRQVLLQTAEMSFSNFSISSSFSFLEFNNLNEVSQRIPTSAYKKTEVMSELLDLKQWRNMEILGFVRKLLFASVLQLKTTCRELNLSSFRIFSINLFFYKILNALSDLLIGRSNINLNTPQVFTYNHVYV